MALSIGIEYTMDVWKTCLMEDGYPVELHTFSNAKDTLSYIEQLCMIYPDPIITITSASTITDQPLSSANEQGVLIPEAERQVMSLEELVRAMEAINSKSFPAPELNTLTTIPRYRKLSRGDMGSAATLCAVAALLHRMRQQEASWTEMRFLYLEVDRRSRSIVVIKDGQVVDGIHRLTLPAEYLAEEDETVIEEAFWEGLSQDLAGLMATHHFEDIVVIDRRSANGDGQEDIGKDAVIERFNTMYQFYHFPRNESEPEGFESVIGAAVIAEGLYHPGIAAEIVERLHIRL